MANPNTRILLRPLEHGHRHGPVPARRHDPFHDLILRLGGEVEQRLEVDRFSVFAEDEGGVGVGDADLAGVERVFREAGI